jgi:hypothetical protein
MTKSDLINKHFPKNILSKLLMVDRGKLFQELFEYYKKLMADRSARESQEAATMA